MFKKLKLSTKILLLGVVIVCAFTAVLIWMFPKLRTTMYDAKYVKTKHLVESTCSLLEYYAKEEKSGALPMEEAQKMAKSVINNMRYDKEEYFWINDMRPVMIMHPIKPEMNGQDISNNVDPTGKRLFMEMVDVCKKSGEGFVKYMWPKAGESKPVPKISYVKLLPAWNWIVGSGIYIDDVEKEINQVLMVIVIVVTVLFVGGVALSIFLAQSIARPINRIVGNLNMGSDQTSSAAGQVSSASQQLSQGATEQAASLEETSSSLDEMNSMTRQNADNAGKANQFAQEARRAADEGNTAMLDMQKAMAQINESSDKISKIIKTIEEIAFQTNLLALNAAVEAARAGEHGKGFAVVADEVRNLAQRAAASAKDTASLIEDSINKVKGGTEITKKAGASLNNITENAKKVADIISEIAAASKEQAEGIGQVTTAVSQMDQVTQQNASAAEECASSAEELSSQAEALRGMVVELNQIINGSSSVLQERSRSSGIERRSVGAVKQLKMAQVSKAGIRKVEPKKGPKVVKPEEVIPLDDDKGFKEF